MSTTSNTKFLNGNLAVSGNTTVANHLVPSLNELVDIGSADSSFKDMYLSGNTVYLGDTVLTQQNDTIAIKDTIGNNVPVITKEVIISDGSSASFSISINNGNVELYNTNSTVVSTLSVNQHQTFSSITTGSIIANETSLQDASIFELRNISSNIDIIEASNGSINTSSMIFVNTLNVTSNNINTVHLLADNGYIQTLVTENAVLSGTSTDNAVSNVITVGNLNASHILSNSGISSGSLLSSTANITTTTIANASLNTFDTNNVSAGNVSITNASIGSASITTLIGTIANANSALIGLANVSSLSGTSIISSNASISNLNASSGDLSSIISTSINASTLNASNILSTNYTIPNILVSSASINTASISNAHITNVSSAILSILVSTIGNANLTSFTSSNAYITNVNVSNITIASLLNTLSTISSASIINISSGTILSNNISSSNANITSTTLGDIILSEITTGELITSTINTVVLSNSTSNLTNAFITSGAVDIIEMTFGNISSSTISNTTFNTINSGHSLIDSIINNSSTISNASIANLTSVSKIVDNIVANNITTGILLTTQFTTSDTTIGNNIINAFTTASLVSTNANIINTSVGNLLVGGSFSISNTNIINGTVSNLASTNISTTNITSGNIVSSSVNAIGIASTTSIFTTTTIGNLEVSNINFTGTLTQNGGAVNLGGCSGGNDSNAVFSDALQFVNTTSRYKFISTGSFYTRVDGVGNDTVSSIAAMTNNGIYSAVQSDNITTVYSSNGSSILSTMGASWNMSQILQFGPTGGLNWNVQFDGIGNENITTVKTAALDNAVLFGGSYSSTSLLIYATNGTALQMTIGNETSGTSVGIVGRIASSGALDWTNRIDSLDNESVLDVSKSSVDNGVYYGGVFSSTGLNIYNTDGVSIQASISGISNTSQGNTKGFIAKSSSSGQLLWTMRIGGLDLNDQVTALADSHIDSSLVFGAIYNSTQFAIYATNGTTIQATYMSNGARGSLVGRVTSTGSLEWGVRMCGAQSEIVNDIAVSGVDNSIYFALTSTSTEVIVYKTNGRVIQTRIQNNFRNAYNFNIGVIGKIASSGLLLWHSRIEGIFPVTNPHSIISTTDGGLLATIPYSSTQLNVYDITGKVLQVTLGNKTTSGNQLSSALLKFNSSGTLLYSSRIDDIATNVVEMSDLNVYASGFSNASSVNVYTENNVLQTTILNASSTGSLGYIIKYINQTSSSFDSSKVYLYQTISNQLTTTISKSEIVYNTSNSFYTRIDGIGNDAMSSISRMSNNGVYTAIQSDNVVSVFAPRSETIISTMGNANSGITSYVSQFNPTGDFNWSVTFDGTGDDNITTVKSAALDNAVLFGGSYSSTSLLIYATNGTVLQMTIGNETSGTSVGIVGRIASSGALNWTNRIDGLGNESVLDVSKSTADNGVYYGGVFSTTGLNIYTTDGSTIQASISGLPSATFGNKKGFIIKSSSSGQSLWSIRIGGINLDDQVTTLAELQSDSSLAFGAIYNSTQFAIYATNGTTIQATYSSNGAQGSLVGRVTSTGSLQWGVRMCGTQSETVNDIVVSAVDNSIYFAGQSTSYEVIIYRTDGSTRQAVLSKANEAQNAGFAGKLSSLGTLLWVSKIEGSLAQNFASISASTDGGLLLTGTFTSNQLIVYGTNGHSIQKIIENDTTNGNSAGVLLKYDSMGTLLSGVKIDGSGNEAATAVEEGLDNSIYISGIGTSNNVNIYDDIYEIVDTIRNSTTGTSNAYFIKYGSSITTSTISSVSTPLTNYSASLNIGTTVGNHALLVQTGFTIPSSTFDYTMSSFYNRFDGSGNQTISSISLISNNDLYIATQSDSDMNFYASTNESSTNTFNRMSNIIRINTGSNISWNVGFDGIGIENIVKVNTSNDDAALFAGNYNSTLLSIYGTNGTILQMTLGNESTTGTFAGIIGRINGNGTLEWTNRVDGIGNESILDVSKSTADNGVYYGGVFSSTGLNFYATNGNTVQASISSNKDNNKGFIAKSSSVGQLMWSVRIGGQDLDDQVNALVETPPDNSISFGGRYTSTQLAIYETNGATIQATYILFGTQGSFVGKIGSTGTLSWVSVIGEGSSNVNDISYSQRDTSIYFSGHSIATQVNIYATNGTAIQGTLINAVTNGALNTGFVGKYSSSGALIWTSKIEGVFQHDFGNVTSTTDGGVLLTGVFTSSQVNIYNTSGNIIQKSIYNDSSNASSMFLKFSSTGQLIFDNRVDGVGNDILTSQLEASNGSIYIAGLSSSTNVSLYGEFDNIQTTIGNIATNGSSIAYMIRYSPIETLVEHSLQYRTDGNLRVTGTTTIDGNLMVAGTKNFEITHPVPEKAALGLKLRHSAIETPTNGDNMHRYTIRTVNGYAEIELPDYFGYLNGNVQTMCSGIDNYGDVYGEYHRENNVIQVYSNIDGRYNVIVIGTRTDL